MSTAPQLIANLANAQFSTGPRSDAGKAISSRNSLKHGLTALTVLLPGEDPAEYQAFSTGMLNDLAPETTIESSLAQELIDLAWRLQRVSRFEARILSADAPDFKALNNLGLHASRMKRQYSASLKELLQLKGIRLRSRQAGMENAAVIRRADIINRRPTNLTPFGSVFTVEEVDAWIRGEDAVETARKTVANARPGRTTRL